MFELDHLAIAAETLDEGRSYVEERLGVTLQPGGRHDHFGTHNLLLGLDDGLYLEVISIDPRAPAPGHPRWFDLDRFSGAPRISNWISRTDTLSRAVKLYPEAGVPVALVRGDLKWMMAVPENGILPFDGAFPALIEWQGSGHPAQRLQASGCRLQRLIVSHPDVPGLSARLGADMRDPRVEFMRGARAFSAEIATPHGVRTLT